MKLQTLLYIRKQWLAGFIAYPTHSQRVGLTALTLLRLNPEQPLTEVQFQLLKAALQFTVRYDYSEREELDYHSRQVTDEISHRLINQTERNLASQDHILTASIPQYYECMQQLSLISQERLSIQNPIANDSLAETLKQFNLQQCLAVLKTERKFSAGWLIYPNIAATLQQSISDYELLYNIPNRALTNAQVTEYMALLRRTNAFNLIIKEGETALGLALRRKQRNLALAIMQHNPNLLCANEYGYSPWHHAFFNVELVIKIFKAHPELFGRLTGDALCRPIQSGAYQDVSLLFLFVLRLEDFLRTHPNHTNMMARIIWNNFERLVNNIHANSDHIINENNLNKLLQLHPQFQFLLVNNTRQEMLAAYQQRDYVNNVVVVLSQGAKQPASPLFGLPRLVWNHIAMFASKHPHMNPQSALAIATSTITVPQATANSSSSSAVAGTRRVPDCNEDGQSTVAAKRTRK